MTPAPILMDAVEARRQTSLRFDFGALAAAMAERQDKRTPEERDRAIRAQIRADYARDIAASERRMKVAAYLAARKARASVSRKVA